MIHDSNLILAIDTSCDETSAAVVCDRRVLSNVISSQINIHKKYGGVFPALAKRAHQDKIDFVVKEAIARAKSEILNPKSETNSNDKNSNLRNISNFEFRASNLSLQAVAVTYGPGLAIALEVGIIKAKELAEGCGWETRSELRSEDEECNQKNKISSPPTPDSFYTSHPHIPLIAVNHLEGHIYSCLAQNTKGLPVREIQFPALCLIVSGGHTELVLMKDHGKYEVIGATLDDACGEALDKAAKILQLGYPGGPIIERLAEEYILSLRGVTNDEAISYNFNRLPRGKAPRNDNRPYIMTQSLKEKSNLNFSYSGLKTQFLYLTQEIGEEEMGKNLKQLAFVFQEASFEQLIRKTSQAINKYQPKTLLCGGGVIANKYLRKLLRNLAKKEQLPIFFPPNKKLITDNAAMIGIAASYKFQRKEFVEDTNSLERIPRLSL